MQNTIKKLIVLHAAWERTLAEIKEKRDRFIGETQAAIRDSAEQTLKSRKDKAVNTLTNYLNAAVKYREQLQSQRDALGLFKMREKQELKDKIADIDDAVLDRYGRLIFPVNTSYYSGNTLGGLSLTWYSAINPDKTVEICNYFRKQAENGKQIFYDIYTDSEKKADSEKKNTGLFFFRGNKNARTAICNAGGGFAYVGAMHDSFPHALELRKKGYNAFALIYRSDAQKACQDLARAIAFLFENADDLGIDMNGYSLWEGSAGARMAAWLGSYGTASFGEKAYPFPAAVIMQYTGLGEVYGNEPPTYNCVGTNDYIASYQTMQNRINRIKKNGTDAEIEIFKDLSHGFGLGEGTVAEGWINNAVEFWERSIK